MEHNKGPDPNLVKHSRTTHIQHLEGSKILSLEDNWNDPVLAQSKQDNKWIGRSIFIEEVSIPDVLSMDIDEYLDLDYENNKEAWKEMEMENVSTVETEPFDLNSRISSTEICELGGTELDSHADSPVVGRNCFIHRRTGKSVNVRGFSDALGKPMEVDVVDAIVAYDDSYDGDTYLLMIKNALYVPTMDNNLVPPFMMRLAGIEVNECPKFLSEFPTIKNHAILFREENIRIPLQLKNTISYIPTRVPTKDELLLMGTPDIKVMFLTPNSPSWNPHNETFESQENGMVDARGDIILAEKPTRLISDVVFRIDDVNLQY